MALTDLQNMKPKMNRVITLRKIDIEDIKLNTRNFYPQDDIDELKENIKEYGLLKPLEVYEFNDHYVLLGGHRRYAALVQLVLNDEIDAEVSCIVYPKPQDQTEEMLQIISSNAQRVMDDKLRMKIVKELMDILQNHPEKKPDGMPTREWLSGYLGCSSRTVQKYINQLKNNKPRKYEKDKQYDFAESMLRNKFSTKVSVNDKKITISVTGIDDLNRVLALMGCIDHLNEGGI